MADYRWRKTFATFSQIFSFAELTGANYGQGREMLEKQGIDTSIDKAVNEWFSQNLQPKPSKPSPQKTHTLRITITLGTPLQSNFSLQEQHMVIDAKDTDTFESITPQILKKAWILPKNPKLSFTASIYQKTETLSQTMNFCDLFLLCADRKTCFPSITAHVDTENSVKIISIEEDNRDFEGEIKVEASQSWAVGKTFKFHTDLKNKDIIFKPPITAPKLAMISVSQNLIWWLERFFQIPRNPFNWDNSFSDFLELNGEAPCSTRHRYNCLFEISKNSIFTMTALLRSHTKHVEMEEPPTKKKKGNETETGNSLSNENGNLAVLPENIIFHILSYADWETIVDSKRVCQLWNKILNQDFALEFQIPKMLFSYTCLIETKQTELKKQQQKLVHQNQTFDFDIFTLTDCVYRLKCDYNTTCENLKEKIQDRCGIPVDQQRIIVNGKQLEDTRFLHSYRIPFEANYGCLVLRLRGD